jgi:hypothetical protein
LGIWFGYSVDFHHFPLSLLFCSVTLFPHLLTAFLYVVFFLTFSPTPTQLLILPHRFIDERHSMSLKCLGWHPSSATFMHTGAFHILPMFPGRPPPSNIQRVKVVARRGLATRLVHLVRLCRKIFESACTSL